MHNIQVILHSGVLYYYIKIYEVELNCWAKQARDKVTKGFWLMTTKELETCPPVVTISSLSYQLFCVDSENQFHFLPFPRTNAYYCTIINHCTFYAPFDFKIVFHLCLYSYRHSPPCYYINNF